MNPLLALDDSEGARRQALLGMIANRQMVADQLAKFSSPTKGLLDLPELRNSQGGSFFTPLLEGTDHVQNARTFAKGLLEGFRDFVTAPKRALTGELEMRDPVTGMVSEKAIEEGFNAAGSMMLGGFAGTPLKPKGALGIFGGRNAKTADQTALAKAEAMAAQGAARKTIWDETGWFQGADGKWRFEIDDSGSKVTDKALDELTAHNVYGASQRTARGTLEHKGLYDAYPEAGSIDVDARYNVELPYQQGYYQAAVPQNGNRAQIGFSTNALDGNMGPRDILLHELQHDVQRREGFATGGSTKDKSLPSATEAAQAINDRYRPELDRLAKEQKWDEYFDLDDARRAEIEPILAEGPNYGYRHLAGEAEARNVQTRRDMTPEERRARPPWETQDVPDAEQIVRFRSEGRQQSIGNPLLKSDLPMDEASRMARARELGYADETFYHGTNAPVENFEKRGKGNGMTFGTKERAVFLTDNPAVADSYLSGGYVRADAPAALEHGTAPMPGNNVGRYYSEGANVMPLRVRDLDKFEVWDMGGAGYRESFVTEALKEARKNKAPGVVFENIRDPGVLDVVGPVGSPRVPSRTIAVLDPSVLRSPSAAFDPKSQGKGTLLGSGSTDKKSAAATSGLLAGMNEQKAIGNPLLSEKAIKAYHGSPHDFDRFDLSKSREGNYGPAIYAHTDEADANRYKMPGGRTYELEINPTRTFEMDKPISADDQARVYEAMGKPELANMALEDGKPRSGSEFYYWLMGQNVSKAEKADALRRAGFDAIIGDPGKEIAGKSTRSPEIAALTPEIVSIIRKYGVAGLAFLPPAVAAQVQAHMEAGGEL